MMRAPCFLRKMGVHQARYSPSTSTYDIFFKVTDQQGKHVHGTLPTNDMFADYFANPLQGRKCR